MKGRGAEGAGKREGQKERESKAGSTVSMEPNLGLDPSTLES